MGTRLYNCKITKDSIITPMGYELLNLLPSLNFNENWLPELLCWLEDENGVETFEDFRKRFKSYVDKFGQDMVLEKLSDNYFFSRGNYKRLSSLLHSNLAEGIKSDDFYFLEGYYFGNNFLSELLPKYFHPASLRQIKMDVVTVNEDAGFPNTILDKDFCIRLLVDADGGMDSRLYKHFNNGFYEENFGGKGEDVYSIVAGAKRIGIIDMEVENPEFWDNNSHKWWASLKDIDVFQAASNNKPFQVITYLIYIHPSWLGRSLSTEPFDSTAYAVFY